MSNVLAKYFQGLVVESSHAMPGSVSSRPVAPSQLDSPVFGVDNCHSLCGEGELYPVDIEKGGLTAEGFLHLVILLGEGVISIVVVGVPHISIYVLMAI